MGLLQSRVQSLGVAAALVCAFSLAAPSTSQAAPSRASGTNSVNGPPCNDLCKAYMAWSNRILARFHPPQPQMRVAVRHKQPDRPVHHASGIRPSSLNVFAQLRRPSDAAPRSVETPRSVEAPQVQAAPSEPVQPILERPFPADGIAIAKPVDAAVAASESPETTLVSMTTLVSATPDAGTQDTGTTGHFARGLDGRFALSLALALCALLSLLSWRYFRRWTQTENTIR